MISVTFLWMMGIVCFWDGDLISKAGLGVVCTSITFFNAAFFNDALKGQRLKPSYTIRAFVVVLILDMSTGWVSQGRAYHQKYGDPFVSFSTAVVLGTMAGVAILILSVLVGYGIYECIKFLLECCNSTKDPLFVEERIS
jgi:hypothetical protein